ncbi:flavin reductase family protein [Spirochaeta isovalerica]|uniref:Flavin reductase (DIM6/NTAB) family NADH-FMN oxidoreductase RutF n=1 Tax=Spirochaeta isovalerica TaxID=150 RepID=A0A841R9L0_9SPIO|nr:flavin reductase family protein [Spirochaeta isovalerica]MBB6480051.1 flavin reductase (DIM6/NTAB) family NADH-FMN oxidoreductase RutF [Spirochaeta isovalerica]
MNRQINSTPLLHGVPIVLLCAESEGKVDVTTIGDVAVMGLNPPLVGFSTHENHLITELIDRERKVTINIPEVTQMKEVDFCGIHSGRERDKASLFRLERTEGYVRTGDCPVNLHVKVLERVQIKQRVIYTGEVKATYVREDLIPEGKLDMRSLKSLHYGLDNRYYSIGGDIGTGYREGRDLS